jgi:hypothetical protein
MRVFLTVLLAFLVVGCASGDHVSKGPTKQPMPSRPLVMGQISGVVGDTQVIIHIRTPGGWEAYEIFRRGNGNWESVVTDASGLDYIVTAEAEGYISDPASHAIHLGGDTAYVVCDGQVTDEEAIHLDFHFESRGLP